MVIYALSDNFPLICSMIHLLIFLAVHNILMSSPSPKLKEITVLFLSCFFKTFKDTEINDLNYADSVLVLERGS